MKISRETLHQLIENKLYKAGLKREHAATVADVWFMQMPEVFTHMAPYALNIMPNEFQKAAPTGSRRSALRIPVPVRRYCMPIMLPDRSQPKWEWSMLLK
ncbi:hypothetical protein Sent01_02077 [Salmonella enterica]|nr:ureidoglycolate dehydrogenase [Salmonella enterica subsp. enterica serovar Pullorum str. 13036]ESG05301.1 ureidoglycolate dehydrogenase [Salmonella enterica subsp. enterica serovar Pullorum str. 19945]ETX33294.1 Ureidoglycolate dehydrogenase [Salmonella enterica subsp. enterica serovar Gallinarum/Pullorum str. FCAV198]CZQ31590.1 ureidoglycolate dehydrogenase [Salmonella enterica subsp. enterica serovar Pullorum]SUG06531.1 ureidoglycolate dehydrogenase [Salmonella enterica subsp. enterica ser